MFSKIAIPQISDLSNLKKQKVVGLKFFFTLKLCHCYLLFVNELMPWRSRRTLHFITSDRSMVTFSKYGWVLMRSEDFHILIDTVQNL